MTVLGITTSSSPTQPVATSKAAQARQAFTALGAALAEGDLAAAQTALATLQQKIHGGGQGKSQNPDNAKQLLSALAAALKAGTAGTAGTDGTDGTAGALEKAQQLYAQLQKNIGDIKGKGHDHSHKGGRARSVDSVTVGGSELPPPPQASPPPPEGSSTETPTSPVPSGEIDVMA